MKKGALYAVVGCVCGFLFWVGSRREAETVPASPSVTTATRSGDSAAAAKETAPARGPAASPRSRETPPRLATEWQGMKQDASITPPCYSSARCGLARACIDGVCVACLSDSECAEGEVCVLDNCLLGSQVECRKAADCDAGSMCVISGYSSDIRGNAETKAYCSSGRGGVEKDEFIRVPTPPRPKMETPETKIMEVLRAKKE